MGRDGQSTYFINNAVARRRDVQDLFLGTGLEIAMQSLSKALFQAWSAQSLKSLGSYVEEAAGISKYKKEKRNRIKNQKNLGKYFKTQRSRG